MDLLQPPVVFAVQQMMQMRNVTKLGTFYEHLVHLVTVRLNAISYLWLDQCGGPKKSYRAGMVT